MITDIRNIKIFTSTELSNEDYHAHDNVSGSTLAWIYKECPADFKFKEEGDKPKPALVFGTASHAAWLEPDLFNEQFACGLDKEDYPNSLTSDAAIKAELKKRGLTGYAKYTGSDLIIFAVDNCPDMDIFNVRLNIFECENRGKTIIKKSDYQNILKMRETLFNDSSINELLVGAQLEMSIICDIEIDGEWYPVKIRPDIITKNCEVPDYKSVASMQPDKFGRDAYEFGYWLKQAFVTDVLKAAYNQDFKAGLIAQGKTSPFIHQLYWLTQDQLQVGREQYLSALKYYKRCKDSDTWPAYFDGAVELPTPEYLAKRFGFS